MMARPGVKVADAKKIVSTFVDEFFKSKAFIMFLK